MVHTAMAAIETLPADLVWSISDHLPTETILSLVKTNRQLHYAFTQLLYRRATKSWKPNPSYETPLHLMASRGNAAAIIKLIDVGRIPVDCGEPTPLQLAASAGHLNAVRALLLRKANPQKRPAAVYLAAKHGHGHVFDELFPAFLRLPTRKEENVLHAALFGPFGSFDVRIRMAEAVLATGHPIDSGLERAPALHWAVQKPHRAADLVSFLLRHGADVNARDRLGRTALFAATGIAGAAGIELVSQLLRAGADPNILDARGVRAHFLYPAAYQLILQYAISDTEIYEEYLARGGRKVGYEGWQPWQPKDWNFTPKLRRRKGRRNLKRLSVPVAAIRPPQNDPGGGFEHAFALAKTLLDHGADPDVGIDPTPGEGFRLDGHGVRVLVDIWFEREKRFGAPPGT